METQTPTQQFEDYQRVAQAIRYIEAHQREHPTLEAIAASVHLSPYHFQRLFKRWAGLTPAQFMQALTVEEAKRRLRASESVLDAALEAGLSGPGRLHDLFVTYEALTPGEFKRQGEGLEIAYGFHPGPFGATLLATTARGICALAFLDPETEAEAVAWLAAQWPRATLRRDEAATAPLAARLYPPAGEEARPLRLVLRGTNFQVAVWRALMAIPPGVLVSYQAVAEALGRPTATRAVAGAIAHNPIAWIIPCHRVISQVGQLRGYRWGLTRKAAMLAWEAGQEAATAAS
jgi:AraC family transcriptional regulator of adaptative response/methylated-DNA-[protein]-cysteine methyltransferase